MIPLRTEEPPDARLRAALAADRPLLHDHPRLRSLLESAAVADPGRFFLLFLHHCMATGAALDQGAAEEDVAGLVSGRWTGAALLAELGHANSNSRTHTEAVFDPATREFVLSSPVPGAAKYPATFGPAGFATLAVVSARLITGGTEHGTALFLVPVRDERGPCPGVTIEPCPPTALLPLDYATVRFDGVRVPYRRWLRDGASITSAGEFHDPLADTGARGRRTMSMGRFGWGAITVGLAAVARASVSLALERASHRGTLDRLAGEIPAIEHLNQQRLLFGALASALAATTLARRETGRYWSFGAPPGVHRELGLTKVAVTSLADDAVNRARSASGTAGFFSEHRLIGYQGLTLAFQSAGGDNRLIRLDAAWTMAAGQDYTPPAAAPGADKWVTLFGHRERLLHEELTTGLDGTFAGWNARSELALRFTAAHSARVTAEVLSGELPSDLYELHCLEEVEAQAGWFLAHGLLTAGQVLGLPERINEICRRLHREGAALGQLLEISEERAA
ncbi:hypothetical protein MUY14_02335 [Amycolatopsis sp. FBCC-B4732]|uniref:hypothetical protein n=1 Tax=Amycolatopsis sp. FBCC-B4732 TaxID=3079339 RepID=UPI001FF5A71B|nr:hypothetical protein [Amycolatopsis sp. FBCC-B4732]UOX89501.1 hypothetical protein MUY14_02335 [Amycolatopsis sp. FBCC-B4732]